MIFLSSRHRSIPMTIAACFAELELAGKDFPYNPTTRQTSQFSQRP
jgi:hypothetical protein